MQKHKSLKGVIADRLYVYRPSYRLRSGIIAALSFPNPHWERANRFSPWGVSAKIPKTIEVADYDPDRDVLIVPRGLNPRALPDDLEKMWNRVVWRDRRTQAPVKFPEPLLKPNEEQRSLVRDFRHARRDDARPYGAFLFVAPTSVGKTIAQALLARETGQRTLVLCQTNLIKKAWYDDLLALYGLKKSDIGLIQGPHWSIGDVFTIASIATLGRRRARWAEISQTFGTVILDEAHTVTAPTIYQFIENNRATFHFGATATPKKNNFRLISNFGKPRKRLFATQRNTSHSMVCRFVDTVQTDFEFEYDPLNLNWHELSDALACDEERNELIAARAFEDWRNGHSVLVVSKRVPHVHLLAKMLREAGIKHVNVITGETNAKKEYTAKLVAATLDRSSRCLVATDRAVRLGANLNPINRLHLAMPVAQADDLEQLIGRIRRRAKKKLDTGMVYYDDWKVSYLHRSIFIFRMVPLFRKLRVRGFRNVYIA